MGIRRLLRGETDCHGPLRGLAMTGGGGGRLRNDGRTKSPVIPRSEATWESVAPPIQ